MNTNSCELVQSPQDQVFGATFAILQDNGNDKQ